MGLDLTVLFPTRDRAGTLEQTLEAMARLERGDLQVEIAVVDNASSDETRRVIESFASRLPLRYLYEDRAGKNRALNRGLAEARLGELVVFTDDDITPAPDWLVQICEASRRWPEHDVFGGRIDVVWPIEEVPPWARDPYVMEFGFAVHDLGEREQPYPPLRLPFGPNFWVRRRVLEGGRRFDAGIGPHPTNRILGDETLFLRELRRDGFEPLYAPGPRVGHRIQAELLRVDAIRRRAAHLGRGIPHGRGLPRTELLARSPAAWRLWRRASLARHHLHLWRARLLGSGSAGVLASIHAMRNIGYERECLALQGRGLS